MSVCPGLNLPSRWLRIGVIYLVVQVIVASILFWFRAELFSPSLSIAHLSNRNTLLYVSTNLSNSYPASPIQHPCSEMAHERSRLNSLDPTWSDFEAARNLRAETDCESLLESYELPIRTSCAEDSGLGMPSAVKEVMDFRRNVWETVRADLLTMCRLRKKRMLKLEAVRAKNRETGRGSVSNPLKIYMRTWSTYEVFEHAHAFKNCRARCDFVTTAAKADIVVKFEYCDARTGNDHNQLREGQLLAFAGWETPYPSFLSEKGRALAAECWSKLDVYAGYDRFADLPMYFADIDTLLRIKDGGKLLYPRLPGGPSYEKKLHQAVAMKRNDALGILMMSNCRATSWSARAEYRYLYVTELKKHLPLHIYGACGKHKLPPNLGREFSEYATNVRWRMGPCSVTQKYRFFFAFENALRDGYVTEKLWNALLCPYTIPVYLGAPDIRRYFDSDQFSKYKFFVNANDFPDPRDLAEYLHYLTRNETAYWEFFRWRLDGVIPENTMRPISRVWKNREGENISFPCRMCELIAGTESSTDFSHGEFLWFGKTKDVDQQP